MEKKAIIGWLGMGVMGRRMAGHLLAAGHELHVFSRTKSKAEALLERGAEWGPSPKDVSRKCDVIFTMLGYPRDVQEVYCGSEGILEGCRPGSTLVDMTTSSPELAVEIAGKARRKGCRLFDAPVSGGDVGAENATLAIMCGGDEHAFEDLVPLLRIMGDKIEFFGDSGSGQRVKMSNQILIASSMVGTVEALLYAERANLELTQVIRLIGQGAAGCWSLNQLGPRMVKGDWEPGFFVKHFIKDMGIALEDAKRMGLNLKGLELAFEFYQEVEREGFAEKGTQVLMRVLAKMNKSE